MTKLLKTSPSKNSIKEPVISQIIWRHTSNSSQKMSFPAQGTIRMPLLISIKKGKLSRKAEDIQIIKSKKTKYSCI